MISVKQGDTHDIVERVNMDLTGATVRWLVRLAGTGTTVALPAAVVAPAADGKVAHRLTGDLPAGDHRYEIEITREGQTVTAPTNGYGLLSVVADLG